MNKVFWAHTTAVGGAYYRCMSHALEANKQNIAKNYYIDWDPKRMGNIPNLWERQQLLDDNKRDAITDQIYRLVQFTDITVFQHMTTPIGLALFRMIVETSGKPILMELDDYPFDIPYYNPSSEWCTPDSEAAKITRAQIMAAHGLIVSTQFLKERLLKYNDKIEVIPNCIDFKIWDRLVQNKKYTDKIKIGYAGASGHVGDKEQMKDVFKAILDKYPNVYITLIGEPGVPKNFADLKEHIKNGRIRVINYWKNILEYPQYLKNFNFDICIAPLRDSSFNRSKSNLRYLEYSAMKVPTVASNVRPFAETIHNGVDGYLVKETDEWIDKLSFLIDNQDVREMMGLAAYWNVKKNYNLELVTPRYIKYLDEFKKGFKNDIK